MLGRKKHHRLSIDNMVGPNSRVSGDIIFSGGCHVNGVVKGSVSAEPDSESTLTISDEGIVEGGVTVPYVVLNGIVRGDVFANQRIELGPTARVVGNVYYNLIEMAIGAEINGKLVHQPEGKVPLLEQTQTLEQTQSIEPPRPKAITGT